MYVNGHCWFKEGVPALDHTPCGTSHFQGNLCCKSGFECRENGLCSLPDDSALVEGRENFYSRADRHGVLWVELPSFTYAPSVSLAESLNCVPQGATLPSGFIPTEGCNNSISKRVAEGDWFTCSTVSTCETGQAAIQLIGAVGSVTCRPNASETCGGTQLPPGTLFPQSESSGSSINGTTIAMIVSLPLMVIGVLSLLGLIWYDRRKKRLAREEEAFRQQRPPPPPYRESPTPYQRFSSFYYQFKSDSAKHDSLPPAYPGRAHYGPQSSPNMHSGVCP